MTLPPIDAVRYYEWIGRDIEGKRTFLFGWDVQQIYRSHAAYNRLVVELAQQRMPPGGLPMHLFLENGDYRPVFVWTASASSKRGGTCADGACFLKNMHGKNLHYERQIK